MNSKIGLRFLLLLLVLPGLTACIGGADNPSIKYYLLDPVEAESLARDVAEPLRVEVIDLQIPQYLERFHIATREGENQLVFSEYHQWGENLRKNLLRTLARNLSVLLSSADIATPLNRTSSQADIRLQVHIEAFELGSDGVVRLAARWQLSTLDGRPAEAVQSRELQGTTVIPADDYTAMVTEMRDLYARLCREIALGIIAVQGSQAR
jgi:uncharacterized lipoprotein YmbA